MCYLQLSDIYVGNCSKAFMITDKSSKRKAITLCIKNRLVKQDGL
jgi:ubiquinone biosynthesis protein COQ9